MNGNLNNRPTINDSTTTSTTEVWSAKKTFDNVNALGTELTRAIAQFGAIGTTVTNTPYNGTLGATAPCPNYATVPATGRYIVYCNSYGYNKTSQYDEAAAIGLGYNTGPLHTGYCPLFVSDLTAEQLIYAWNPYNVTIDYGDITIYLIRIA